MPTSVTGSNREGGFTLIELMVVITIIALASAVVVFAIPDPRGRVVDEAERFAARVLAARDDAVVQGRDVRVRVSAGGYSVERRRRGTWEALRDKPFRSVEWAAGTGANGAEAILFDSTGTPASATTLVLTREAARVSVSVLANGDIRVGP
jgi:general secretion pathway protein H